MSSFFESGEETSTQTSAPWKSLPEWAQKAFENDTKFREDLLGQGSDIMDTLNQAPATVVGQTAEEKQALAAGLKGINGSTDLIGKATGAGDDIGSILSKYLGQANGQLGSASNLLTKAQGTQPGIDKSIGKTQALIDAIKTSDPKAAALIKDTALSDKAAGVAGQTNGDLTKAMAAAGFDVDALRSKYESGYTDDVVNTTLAGIDRDAARESLAREGRAAAVGGTSNSRTAVGDAVAGQLTGMNKAEMEAKLRDTAFNTANQTAFQEGQLQLDRGGLYNDIAGSRMDLSGLYDTLAKTGIARGTALGDLIAQQAGTGLDKASAQRGVTADKLSVADLLRGLSGDRLDVASGYGDVAKLGIDGKATQADIYGSGANSMLDAALKKAGLLGTFGETKRGLAQAQADATRNNQRDNLSWLSNLWAGTASGDNKGALVGDVQTTTTPTASPFQSVLGAAASAAGAWLAGSDENIKENVSPIEDALGDIRAIGRASDYDYKPGYDQPEGRFRGLMAQDLFHIPGAVVDDGSGYLKVNPYPVLTTLVDAVKELDRRVAA